MTLEQYYTLIDKFPNSNVVSRNLEYKSWITVLGCFPSIVYLLEQTWQPRVYRKADDPPADDWEFIVLYNLSFLKKLLSFLLTKWRHSFLIDVQHLLCTSKKMQEIHSHHIEDYKFYRCIM